MHKEHQIYGLGIVTGMVIMITLMELIDIIKG
ncbi:hypothetical protein PQE68_gp035 [Bacillus phage vB_BanS_Sophrita]|uniref:Uncharacterized protein n=1 Tax=Bacillus phage vB_BanS_Sophrita TaxID=2894790 RepID=A0AAE9CE01_9CAUD|nr:hypothetical protein PQE68_gp035 [Bacillus phage vB_BanS_Sophrita]UGO50626.1 hypothetical protein SOPHRITA_35 [Bacillus phage vB_BanS_Sophrita]